MEQGATYLTARHYTAQAWEQLGKQLKERREELDPRYHDRGIFAAERRINPKMSQDIERHARTNYTPVTLRDTVAAAYAVTFESILDVLDETGDLAAAPGTRPRRAHGRHAAPAVAVDGLVVPLLTPDRESRARPYADQIAEDRRRWQVAYAAAHPGIDVDDVPEPPGTALFTSGLDAAAWDENADVLTPAERIWLTAELQAIRAAARERQAGTG